MKTKLGVEIPKEIKGVLYLCEYNYNTYELKVITEIMFTSIVDSLQAYSNIPNPESQLATGKNHEELIKKLEMLHSKMKTLYWRKQLADYL